MILSPVLDVQQRDKIRLATDVASPRELRIPIASAPAVQRIRSASAGRLRAATVCSKSASTVSPDDIGSGDHVTPGRYCVNTTISTGSGTSLTLAPSDPGVT
jgi:hypothetical protein